MAKRRRNQPAAPVVSNTFLEVVENARAAIQREPQDRANHNQSEVYGDSLGAKLRYLREKHGLSLRELASRAGVSASLLSEVERDRVEPSISSLKKISNVYGISLTFFFSTVPSQDTAVVRRGERKHWRYPASGPGVHFHLLSPSNRGQIEALLVHYDEGASTGADPDQTLTHEGEEWGFVLSGRLKVIVGDDVHFLEAGDAIHFRSTIPHRVVNINDGPTDCIWVDTPPTF